VNSPRTVMAEVCALGTRSEWYGRDGEGTECGRGGDG